MKQIMLKRTGYMPNILTLGRPVYDVLVDHGDIVGRLDRGQTTGPAKANREQLATLFEVDEIRVMDSIWNSASIDETVTHDFIGGKHGLLSYRPAAPGIMTPCAGYTFAWIGQVGASSDGVRMKRMRIETIEAERIEIQSAYDYKLISAELGAFFNAIVE